MLWVEKQSRKTSEFFALNTIDGGVRKLGPVRVKCDWKKDPGILAGV
jgi:hypothetical protein